MTGPAPAPTLHPESTDDPATLRWVVTPSPVEGHLDTAAGHPAPAALAALLDSGVLARVTARAGMVTTTLADGRDWANAGEAVRAAVHADLAAGVPWPGAAVGPGPEGAREDEAILRSARELVGGPVGAVADAHGGVIRVVGVTGGIVEVELAGACRGCPAVGVTLGRRLGTELRRRHPGVKEVRSAEDTGCPE